MICPDCKEAGRWNTAGLKEPKGNARCFMQADLWHDKCRGGTQCDCQHVVGQALAGMEPK